jgi:hypothetical protein
MAQVVILKLDATSGIAREISTTADDITTASFTVGGGGPVLSATGLDLNNQDAIDVKNLAFNAPSTGYINATAGNLIIDNIMGKERANAMTSAADIQFGAIADVVGEVDSLVLPKLPGAPTAVPTGGEGSFLYDSTNDKLWLYTTAGWDDLSTVSSAASILNSYIAAVNLAARDVVYISANDNVSKALADGSGKDAVIGLAKAAATAAAAVEIQCAGLMSGFSGLVAGSRYFLDASTAGAVTATRPSGSGKDIVLVGHAKNATNLDIRVQYIAKTA